MSTSHRDLTPGEREEIRTKLDMKRIDEIIATINELEVTDERR